MPKENTENYKASDTPTTPDYVDKDHLDFRIDNGEGFCYKPEIRKIDKENINKYIILSPLPGSPYGNGRNIRKSAVNEIAQQLERGIHFRSPLVIERLSDGSFLTLDGGHRLSGISKWVNKNKREDRWIKVLCLIYDFNGLPPDQKMMKRAEVFTLHNSGTTQSTLDFVSVHQTTIDMFPRLAGESKKIPCSIYGTPDPIYGDTLKFKDFVGGYFAGRPTEKEKLDLEKLVSISGFKGGYSKDANHFVDDCRTLLDEQSVTDIEDCWSIISQAYKLSVPYVFKKDKKQPPTLPYAITRTTPFYALMRLILTNKHQFSSKQMIERLRKPEVIESILYHAPYGGRAQCIMCYKDLHVQLNTGIKKERELFLPLIPEEERKRVEQELQEYRERRELLRKLFPTYEEDSDTDSEDIPESV